MAKSSYMGNSAKLLCIVSALLFAANGLIALGSFSGVQKLSSLGSGLSSLALYVVLILGYIAFNGEGVGHKRFRDRKSQKVTGFFKLNLFFCFLLNFIKSALEITAMSLSGVGRTVACLFMSVVSTFGSYGFVLCGVSLWYILRDNNHKKLLPLQVGAFIFGVLYNVYKLVNYAVVKYDITIFGSMFNELFSNNTALKALCLLQLAFDIAMFIQVAAFYGKLGDKEQKVLDDNTRELPRARNVYKDEGYGIDTLEDDFLISG